MAIQANRIVYVFNVSNQPCDCTLGNHLRMLHVPYPLLIGTLFRVRSFLVSDLSKLLNTPRNKPTSLGLLACSHGSDTYRISLRRSGIREKRPDVLENLVLRTK
ncbi:hypothetical protein GOP47_0023140 [Adiantum capillus-veneris]|uniref:Uncharacterized protein n=1 Tax=Adiantum capillus-veneris TaxID=13818 RepID=A0A9D4U6T4_ADICA|nr:hypothetical protein GOP47_0023140 [Adiantum capillus-veneris]